MHAPTFPTRPPLSPGGDGFPMVCLATPKGCGKEGSPCCYSSDAASECSAGCQCWSCSANRCCWRLCRVGRGQAALPQQRRGERARPTLMASERWPPPTLSLPPPHPTPPPPLPTRRGPVRHRPVLRRRGHNPLLVLLPVQADHRELLGREGPQGENSAARPRRRRQPGLGSAGAGACSDTGAPLPFASTPVSDPETNADAAPCARQNACR